jgi:hypothetical protein
MRPSGASRRRRPVSLLGGTLSLALAAIAASCSTGPASTGPASTSDAGSLAPTGRALRRLSQREYDNVVHDLLGDTSQPASHFGTEVYVNGFDNGSDGLTVQGTDVIDFQEAAEALAARAVQGNMSALVGSCDPAAGEMPCVDAFLTGFVKRAYRRPPTATEAARLRTVFTAGAADGGFSGGIQLMVEAVLQSPAFLYRAELGASDPSLPKNVVRLTDYEVATELSFLITGSMPDETLFTAVESGKLKTADDLRVQALRLMTTPAARPALRAFVHEWMGTDQVASTYKDHAVYPSFTPAVAASMATELDSYFDDVLWTSPGSLRELFSSNRSFVDPTLAGLYGVPTGRGTGFRPTTLDPRTRRGVMTRAGFLSAHADTDASGPIPRGVFVLAAILCEPPHPPPPNIPAAPPPSAAAQMHETTRQRFEQHLTESFCRGCHAQIDGVGFGFEEFDGIGVYRTTENGSPVDTSGMLQGTDVDGPFIGVSALSATLMTSQQVLGCFIKHVYRFAMGQEETADSSRMLSALGAGFSADSRVTEVFPALVADPGFVLRTTGNAP